MAETSSYADSRLVPGFDPDTDASIRTAPRRFRVRGLLVALPCWALLATAMALHPSASGYGTHKQLGLGACVFLMRTGLPCITCGLTTSMSATAHLGFAEACHANPVGIFLLLGTVVLGVAGTGEVVTGRDVLAKLRLKWWAYALVLGLPAAWALRLVIGLASGQLPLR
jgi:hypothetical protein